MTWRLADMPPEARRVAEAGAAAAGKPLAEWIAETVQAAVVKELGALPEPPAPEPTLRVVVPVAPAPPPPAPVHPIEAAPPAPRPEPPPPKAAQPPAPPPPMAAPTPRLRRTELDPAVLNKRLPVMGGYQSNEISPETQRLAETGVSDWLASRIEGLPPRAAPVESALAAPASLASIGAKPAPSKPQLDLFPKAPEPVAAPAAPAPATAPPPATESRPAAAVLPLALPTTPVIMLPLTALRPGRCRARRSGGDDGIPALAASVAAHGVREPLLVRRSTLHQGTYEVVAGERRRVAAERAGRVDVPAVVVDASDAEALMLSLTENLGRRDFSPLDEARAYLKLLTEYRVNPGGMAQRLARERAHIAMTLRLLGLPERVRQYIDSGQLGAAQAYDLLKAPDPEALAEQLVRSAGAVPEPGPG